MEVSTTRRGPTRSVIDPTIGLAMTAVTVKNTMAVRILPMPQPNYVPNGPANTPMV